MISNDSDIRQLGCERFERKKEGVKGMGLTPSEIGGESEKKIEQAQEKTTDALSRAESALKQVQFAADQASALSVGKILEKAKETASEGAQKAAEAARSSSVENAIKEGAQSVATGALASLESQFNTTFGSAIKKALGGEGDPQSLIQREITSVTALVDLFIGSPEKIVLVVLDYLVGRLLRDMREMRDSLRTLDTMAGDVIEAVLLAKEAARLLSDEGDRRPYVFERAAEHVDQAAEEVKYKVDYTNDVNPDEFQESSFVRRAIEEVETAQDILPDPDTLPEKAQEAYNLLHNASNRLKKVGAESITYGRRIRTLAESYADALFMAFLIRNLPSNIRSGFRLASLIGADDLLPELIKDLEERARALYIFSQEEHSENRIKRKAVIERAKLELVRTKLAGMEGLLQGSIGKDLEESVVDMSPVVEDPFFFGCGDSLIDVETYGKFVTGYQTFLGSRYDAMSQTAEKMRKEIEGSIENLDGLIAETKSRRPNDPSVRLFRSLIERIGKNIDVDSIMVGMATGAFAANAAKEKFSGGGDSEEAGSGSAEGGGSEGGGSGSESTTGEEVKYPFSSGRKYFQAHTSGSARAELAARDKVSRMEKDESSRDVIQAINDAAKQDESVKMNKNKRLSKTEF